VELEAEVLAELKAQSGALGAISKSLESHSEVLGQVAQSLVVVMERQKQPLLASVSRGGVSLANVLTLIGALALLGGFLVVSVQSDITADERRVSILERDSADRWRDHDRTASVIDTAQSEAIGTIDRMVELMWNKTHSEGEPYPQMRNPLPLGLWTAQ
jgi:hypothetical protein